MNVRAATQGDAGQVLGLVNALLEELGGTALAFDTTAATLGRLIDDNGAGLILLGEEQGRLVAVCTMSFQEAVRTAGRYAIVQEMYVSPELRSSGYGAELMERALVEVRKRGCRVIELGTPPNGARQERFYEGIGFRPVGLRFRKTLNA